jgi:polygalacturonase
MVHFRRFRFLPPFVTLAYHLIHLFQVTDSKNVTFNNLVINATSTSKNPAKNTDGWDVYRSDSVVIENTSVNNGDDCFSAKPSQRPHVSW